MEQIDNMISIITPTYNHEPYIGECIESVLAQTYPHWEMIIVDDGSTDGTKAICEEYAKKDDRIKYHYQKNKGILRLAETYNFALDNSSGTYIAILEGDDYWETQKLEKQIKHCETIPDCIFCWSKAKVVSDDKTVLGYFPRNSAHLPFDVFQNKPHGNFLHLLFHDFPTPVTWLIQKSALQTIGGFQHTEGMPTIDLATIVKLTQLGTFEYIDEVLANYRRQMGQVTANMTTDIVLGSKKIFVDHYQRLSPTDQKSLHFNLNSLLRHFDNQIIISYSRMGRFSLIRKNYVQARSNYYKALKAKGSPLIMWRLRSLIGLVASYLNTDIEALAKLLGKTSYR